MLANISKYSYVFVELNRTVLLVIQANTLGAVSVSWEAEMVVLAKCSNRQLTGKQAKIIKCLASLEALKTTVRR